MANEPDTDAVREDTVSVPEAPADGEDAAQPLPEVFDPTELEEKGVTIPVPTPTGINVPNPWGSGERDPSGAAPNPEPSSDGSSPEAEAE